MSMRKISIFLLLVLLSTGGVFAGGEKEAPVVDETESVSEAVKETKETQSITIMDYYGKEETINLPVKRVVVFDTGAMLNAIKAIKAEDRVVGVVKPITLREMRYPYFSKLPVVGLPQSPNFEDIVALNPDVVLAYTSLSKDLEEKLEPETKVIRLNLDASQTYTQELKKLGIIFEEEENAQTFIDWYQGYVDVITKRLESLSEKEKPRVFQYYGGSRGMTEGPPYGTMGKDNPVKSIIDMAGGNNISGELPGDWIVVDPEWVISENPDIIIREVYPQASGLDIIGYEALYTAGASSMMEQIIKGSALDSTNAVKNNNVFLICGDFIEKEWFIGLHYLARWFHPELFADLDPQVIHQEYISKFIRLDFDLSKHGVFVYSEL